MGGHAGGWRAGPARVRGVVASSARSASLGSAPINDDESMPARVLSALLLILLPAAACCAGLPPQPAPGEVPPPILGKDQDGNVVDLEKHRGKVVVVTFWASWCGPCRREIPMLAKLQQAVGRDHLEVVAVNFKEPRRDYLSVLRANRGYDLTYIHDARGKVSDRYGVQALPNMFIIGADGKIAHVHRGYSEEVVDSFIAEMLALLPPDVLARPAGS